MIKNSESIKLVSYENLHGGKGLVHIATHLDKKDNFEGFNMFGKVTLDIGTSIGYHIHKDDAEAYYILEGQGVFIDNGRVEKNVSSGDLCIITKNQGHGIINCGNESLKMIAVVWEP